MVHTAGARLESSVEPDCAKTLLRREGLAAHIIIGVLCALLAGLWSASLFIGLWSTRHEEDHQTAGYSGCNSANWSSDNCIEGHIIVQLAAVAHSEIDVAVTVYDSGTLADRLWSRDFVAEASCTVDLKPGKFLLRGCHPGNKTIVAEAPGYCPCRADCVLLQDGAPAFGADMYFAKARMVQVLNDTGADGCILPLYAAWWPDQWLRVPRSSAVDISYREPDAWPRWLLWLTADGVCQTLTLAGVCEGTSLSICSLPSAHSAMSAPAGGSPWLLLNTDAWAIDTAGAASPEGRATLRVDAGWAFAQCWLHGADSHWTYSAFADEWGEARFEGIPPGFYVAKAILGPQMRTNHSGVVIGQHDPDILRLGGRLSGLPLRSNPPQGVRGAFIVSGALPAPGAEVVLQCVGPAPRLHELKSSDTGWVDFSRLPAGSYRAAVRRPQVHGVRNMFTIDLEAPCAKQDISTWQLGSCSSGIIVTLNAKADLRLLRVLPDKEQVAVWHGEADAGAHQVDVVDLQPGAYTWQVVVAGTVVQEANVALATGSSVKTTIN